MIKKIVKAAKLGQLGALTPPTMDLSVARGNLHTRPPYPRVRSGHRNAL